MPEETTAKDEAAEKSDGEASVASTVEWLERSKDCFPGTYVEKTKYNWENQRERGKVPRGRGNGRGRGWGRRPPKFLNP